MRFLPVTVVQNDDVGRGKVDAQTTSTRCQQEDKFLATRFVILVNRGNTILVSSTTVNSTIFYQKKDNQ